MSAIQEDGSLVVDDKVTTDERFASGRTVETGDVLIASRSTSVRACVVSDGLPLFAINATLLCIQPDPQKLVGDLLVAYLLHPVGQANLLRLAVSGTVQLNITVRAIESLPIPLPPIEHQRKLAMLFRAAETQKRLAIQAAEAGYRLASELVFRDLVTTEKK